MPYAHKAQWKDVLGKPADKLFVGQCHLFCLPATAIVFVSKVYPCLIYLRNTLIADGYFVGVSAGVFYHLFRPAKRPFGIHHPFFFEQAVYQWLILHTLVSQLLHILSPKHFAKCFYRKQVFIAAQIRLPFSVFIYASTRHNAVQVRVQAKVLPLPAALHGTGTYATRLSCPSANLRGCQTGSA